MSKIIKDQEYFFNQNSHQEKLKLKEDLFYQYSNQEQFDGFNWIEKSPIILEYGCGTGTSLDIFFKTRKPAKYNVYGVDIAEMALKKAAEKYPNFTFYKINNNKMAKIKKESIDAAFLFHVLHHTHNHDEIFKEINRTLKRKGKFLINDLTSNNLFNRLARALFILMPVPIKDRFNDDLVVGGSIPDKYPVSVETVVSELQQAGFRIEEVSYGHLFFFLFSWIDRFIPFSKIPLFESLYRKIMELEYYLLKYRYFQNMAELVSIKAVKV